MTKPLLCAAAACALLGAACGETETHAAEAPAARPVRAVDVRPLDGPSQVRYSVNIQPAQEVPASFKAAGYVAAVTERRGVDGRVRALQPGDTVAPGTLLARVRDLDYQERINEAKGALEEADAALAKARADLDRATALFTAESLTKPDLDAAQAAFDAASARVSAGRARLRLADISLRETSLLSPIGGVVLERRVEAGALVGVGTVGFVVADVAAVKAIFGVPDSLVHRIAAGQSLDVTTEAFPSDRFAGRVTAISPAADPQSRVFNVEVTIGNADGRLKPGMIGTVAVAATDADLATAPAGTPAIPLAAVVRSKTGSGGSDGYGVFVVDGRGETQTARSRAVRLGMVQGNTVAVIEGLAPGERVIVMGASLLHDGDPVRLIP